MKEITLRVEGMKCEGCESRIKNSLRMLDGVNEVFANYKDNVVIVKIDDNASLDEIKKLIEDLGFIVKE